METKKCPHCNLPINLKQYPCEVCKKPFFVWGNASYCSKACKQKAYRQRRLVRPNKK